MKISSIVALVVGGVILITGISMIGNLVENLDNSKVMVVQAPISGELTWHTTPGMKKQFFGRITKYEKRSQFAFTTEKDANIPPLKTRFNDGAHGFISGSFSWDMPLDLENLTELHTKYGCQESIEQELMKTIIEKAVYMTGPLMSSAESYASRRNELLSSIDDQMNRGVYKTTATDERTKDPMTGQEKTIRVVKLVLDKDGLPAREDKSPLQEFGIRTFNLSFNEVRYDDNVEKQIQSQQQAVMEVQTAIANAKRAEQDAITAAKNGEAEAAKAKWAQEVIKATEVTKAEQEKLVAETAAIREKVVAETAAEQRKNVATFDLESAKLKKETEIALGEGEGKRRQLVMQADGALEKKLDAYIKVNEMYAKAIAEYKGNWVPTINQGGTQTSGSGNGAMGLIDLLSAKAAKDLALDMSLTNQQVPPVNK